MTGAGFSEAMTFGFIGEAAAAPFAGDGDLVPIANPLSENFAVLRPSLAARARSTPWRTTAGASSATCGCSKSASASRGSAAKRRALACRLDRSRRRRPLGRPATRDVDFFDMKGVVERVCGLAIACR